MAEPQTPPEASVPGSQQGQTGDGKPEHQISGPDGVTPTPDSQAANNVGSASKPALPQDPSPPENGEGEDGGNGEDVTFDEDEETDVE